MSLIVAFTACMLINGPKKFFETACLDLFMPIPGNL
jgi:hypothetical protein